MRKIMITAAATAMIAAFVSDASAGGLFGEGGLFRGTGGAILDRYVEKPILTPMARSATVAGAGTVGTMVGGPIGGMVGRHVGEVINERAAGRGNPIGVPTQYQPATVPPPMAGAPAFMPYQSPMVGNFCATPAGRFGPGPVNEVGAPCHVPTQFGVILGHVTM